MTGSSLTIEIVLADGRTMLATPLPEDQELLQSWGDRDVTLTDNADESDTSGHKIAATSDITLDVEGHAMTLRLPNTTDVDTLKKALAVGAVSATIVAAGAIAAMQGGQAAPAIPTTVHPVPIEGAAPVTHPRADFQIRREEAIDDMLAAPPAAAPAVPINVHPVPVSGAAPVNQARPDFQIRHQQQTDEMLEAPGPLPAVDDVATD